MLSEKQKEKLAAVVESLRGKGMETFEEMILFQSEMISEAAKTLKEKTRKIEDYSEALRMNQDENKKLMEELRGVKEQCQKLEAERTWELDQDDDFLAGGYVDPYFQRSTITFNGDPHIDNIEIYYRKDR